MERTGSRGKNLTAKNSSRGSNSISRQNHSFPPKNVRDSSTAHTAVKVMRRRIQRALARKKLLRKLPEQGRTRQATARSTVAFCIHDAHSTQQQAAAARSTPPSRCCCRVSSALVRLISSGNADLKGQRFAFCFFGSVTQSTEPLTLSILLPNRK